MADSGTPLSGSRLSTNFTNWNVNGLYHPIKCTRILAHLKHLKTDTAFLTERQMCSSDCISVFHSSFQLKARGVVILIHKSIPFTASETVSEPL